MWYKSNVLFWSQGENHLLYEREQKLKERERMLSVSQSNLQTITDHQARQQVAAVQQVVGLWLGLSFPLGVVVMTFSWHVRIWKAWRIIPCLHIFFLSGDQLACINSTLSGRISPQWFSKLRCLWTSVPWQVVCELVSLRGSYSILGQYCHSTLTLLGRR